MNQIKTNREEKVLNCRKICMDTIQHTVKINETPLHLTRTEYALLKMFLLNPGKVITKSAVFEQIAADTPDCVESSLNVHICNLRKKIRAVSRENYIESIWGIGFRLSV